MEKVKVTITAHDNKRYATVEVNSRFASQVAAANYRDLPLGGKRIEIPLGEEQMFLDNFKAKVAEAEAAIAKLEEFRRLPPEMRFVKVADYSVAVTFSPTREFCWTAEVALPAAIKQEAIIYSLLGEDFDDWRFDEENNEFILSTIVKDKEEYFFYVQKEMAEVEERIITLRAWRSQPPVYYDLPGNVQVIVSSHPEWASYYEAKVVAPKALIEKAKSCGLDLARGTWLPKGNQVSLTWPLESKAQVASFLSTLKNRIEEALSTEVVAQYSI